MYRFMYRVVALVLLPYMALMGVNTPEWQHAAEIGECQTRSVWSAVEFLDDIGVDLNTDAEDENDTGQSSTGLQPCLVASRVSLAGPNEVFVTAEWPLSSDAVTPSGSTPEPPPPRV